MIAGISCSPAVRNLPTKINNTIKKAKRADPIPDPFTSSSSYADPPIVSTNFPSPYVYAVPSAAPSMYEKAVKGFGLKNQIAQNIIMLKYKVSDTSANT